MGAISKDWVGGVIVVATDWEKQCNLPKLLKVCPFDGV